MRPARKFYFFFCYNHVVVKRQYVEGYNAPAKDPHFFKKLWILYKGLDGFTKMAITTMLLIAVATPIIISTRLSLFQHAQDSTTFIATEGARPLFSVTNLTDNDLPMSSATISWTTSAPAKGKLYYWEDNPLENVLSFFSLGRITFTEQEYSLKHSFTLQPEVLKASTNYKYQITANDQDGQEYVTKVYSFTTVFK